MAEYKSYINALKQCAKEHESELVSFAHIRTTDLCNDTANLLETLEIESDNAIIIPEGATNGDMIKAMFPSARVSQIFLISNDDEVYYVTVEKVDGITNEMRVMKSWWNAPYKKEVEE